MSNEELERKMAFIVEHQAQFTSDIQELREVQFQTEQVVARLANVSVEGFKDVNAKLNALADAQIRTDENMARTDESQRNLIAIVDRYFSRPPQGVDRSGHPKTSNDPDKPGFGVLNLKPLLVMFHVFRDGARWIAKTRSTNPRESTNVLTSHCTPKTRREAIATRSVNKSVTAADNKQN